MTGILTVVLLLAAAPESRQVPRFEARTEVIFVDVFVFQDGLPVTGLAAEDFEVIDDGVSREVELVDLETVPLEVLLVFDVSRSVQGERLEHLRAAGRVFLQGLRPGDTAGLVTFSEEVRLEVASADDRAALEAALERLEPGGMTALYDGLYAALSLVSGPGRRVSIVFSDGEDTMSWLGEEQVRRVAEESSGLVYAVAVASGSNGADAGPEASSLQGLERIARATGGRLWLTSSSAGLESAFGQVLEDLRARHLLRFEPADPPRPGHHRLQVRLKGKRGEVRARPGYFVPARPRP